MGLFEPPLTYPGQCLGFFDVVVAAPKVTVVLFIHEIVPPAASVPTLVGWLELPVLALLASTQPDTVTVPVSVPVIVEHVTFPLGGFGPVVPNACPGPRSAIAPEAARDRAPTHTN